jgi:5-formyltetrahydrofolate cyclo-ligase
VTDPSGDLRAEVLGAREAIEPVRRLELADAISARLDAVPEFAGAVDIGTYYSQGSEVPTGALIRRLVEGEGRRVYLPFLQGDELQMTEWRPSDPVVDAPVIGLHPRYRRAAPMEALDVLLVPGVAYDHAGRRLGSGTGHWDRLLGRLPVEVVTIGIAFSVALVPSLGNLAGSWPVDVVVTESETLAPRRGSAPFA